jgi:hypothetical protein
MTSKAPTAHVESLTVDDIVDEADTSPRAPAPDTSGTRIEAIPYQNCTTVVIRSSDFAANGVNHPDVTWDFRVDKFTVKVGEKISEEAAELLVKNYSSQFKYAGK